MKNKKLQQRKRSYKKNYGGQKQFPKSNSLCWLHSTVEMSEDRLRELRFTAAEFMHSEQRRGNRSKKRKRKEKKTEQRLRDLWDNNKMSNINII